MTEDRAKRLGLLTGGGDCPGLNAVIRAVVRTAQRDHGARVVGIEDGFEGLVEGRARELADADITGLISEGGTILGTSNKGNPWRYPVVAADGTIEQRDESARALQHLREWRIDALIAVGGDGTMHLANRFAESGIDVIGVPKTIDNDLAGTDVTFGFDTAVHVITEALDRLSTTASSHHRVMVVETMGRYAGWLALAGGVAGAADVILIPEIPFRWDAVARKVIERSALGKRFSMVVVAEGARLPDGGEVVRAMDAKRTDPKQLGGVGAVVAQRIEADTGLETRAMVLGHLQRGGTPTAHDRVLATRLGTEAARCACTGVSGVMMAVRGADIVPVPVRQAIASLRTVPPQHDLVRCARSIGIAFGDETLD